MKKVLIMKYLIIVPMLSYFIFSVTSTISIINFQMLDPYLNAIISLFVVTGIFSLEITRRYIELSMGLLKSFIITLICTIFILLSGALISGFIVKEHTNSNPQNITE